MPETLFKYRSLSLQSFKYTLDIFVNNRLYMASYREQNDPMEGFYDGQNIDPETVARTHNDKLKLKICSLSSKKNNMLMWSHYADSHKGCCIEIKVTEAVSPPRHIEYSPILFTPKEYTVDMAKEILCHKFNKWAYEDEWRYIKEEWDDKKTFLNVQIEKVYLGCKMSQEDVNFYTRLIGNLLGDPNKVIQLQREDLDIDLHNYSASNPTEENNDEQITLR